MIFHNIDRDHPMDPGCRWMVISLHELGGESACSYWSINTSDVSFTWGQNKQVINNQLLLKWIVLSLHVCLAAVAEVVIVDPSLLAMFK